MRLRALILLLVFVSGGLWLASLGCNRSSVVVTPETAPPTDETVAARAQSIGAEVERFSFPADSGGELLVKLLPPRETDIEDKEKVKRKERFTATDGWQATDLPLPRSYALLPRMPLIETSTTRRPHLDLDETMGELPQPPALQTPSLPEGVRLRVPSPDVNQPIALPILGQPLPQRASLEDPTLDYSTRSALAAPLPIRKGKAPFLKLTIPDPYDGRRTDGLPPQETRDFPVGSPALPPR